MQFPVFLPNKKEITVKSISLKDLKYLSLLAQTSLKQSIEFLESFIITKNLNVFEKLVALLTLRNHCIDDSISMPGKAGNVKMKINHVLNNIGDMQDIKESITLNGADFILGYPSQFNSGNSDSIFTIIKSIQIGDEQILINELTNKEFSQLLATLPTELYGYLEDYVARYQEHFIVKFWDERKRIGVEEMHLSILSDACASIILNLFNILSDPQEYAQYIFNLSKRIPDPEFLSNSTVKELDQYIVLYKQEIAQASQDLKSQTSN